MPTQPVLELFYLNLAHQNCFVDGQKYNVMSHAYPSCLSTCSNVSMGYVAAEEGPARPGEATASQVGNGGC